MSAAAEDLLLKFVFALNRFTGELPDNIDDLLDEAEALLHLPTGAMGE